MKISLKEVAASSGHVDVHYNMDLSGEQIHFEYPFQKPVLVSGSVKEGKGFFTLSAVCTAQVDTHCARCGRALAFEKTVPVEFVLSQTEQEMDGVYAVEGDIVDLDEIVSTELILNMDMTVLCDEACRGVCRQCGKNLNDGPCDCDVKRIDPRLEKLARLLQDDNE